MKFLHYIATTAICLTLFSSCQKDFVQINTDPNALTALDARFLFSNAEYSTFLPQLESEATIVQQFVNPFTGVTAAFNFNTANQAYTPVPWNNSYNGTIKLITQVISQVKTDPTRSNLYNEARIWRAYAFMMLVDTYGDVPYSDAGLGYLNSVFYPKYDKQDAIYADLVNELTTASAALDPNKDIVTADIFYAGNVAQWKRLGYSLLLRIGMRYTKADAAKAQSIAQAAFAGGVMTSNADNCYIKFNGTFTNPVSTLQSTQANTYYLAQPFIDQLKNSGDPRIRFIAATYANPGAAPSSVGDTVASHQFGLSVGYSTATLSTAPGYRGANGSGFNYSQLNYSIFGKVTAPHFLVTYAQTSLLLADAAARGWITGSGAATYYANGVKASMDQWATYDASAVIPVATENSFLANPVNAYTTANALQLINTQYWIASWGMGNEAWANFRRTGYPALTPNPYSGKTITGAFVHRFTYPQSEQSNNLDNYKAAVISIGGSDDMDTHVFWDK